MRKTHTFCHTTHEQKPTNPGRTQTSHGASRGDKRSAARAAQTHTKLNTKQKPTGLPQRGTNQPHMATRKPSKPKKARPLPAKKKIRKTTRIRNEGCENGGTHCECCAIGVACTATAAHPNGIAARVRHATTTRHLLRGHGARCLAHWVQAMGA